MSKKRNKAKQKQEAGKAAVTAVEQSAGQESTPKGQTKAAPRAVTASATESKPSSSAQGDQPQKSTASGTSLKGSHQELPFGPANFKLLGVGIALLLIGYYLLSLDPFIDATKFSISLYIAPVVIIGGYVEILFAILKRPQKHQEN